MASLIIYHSPCADGMASAWCFTNYSIQAKFEPYNYDKSPPKNVSNYEYVYIVDFSFDPEDIEKMATQVKKKVIVLDHHQTACDKLMKLSKKRNKKLDIVLDTTRAGCQITWDYLCDKHHKSIRRPPFLDYIADRDLWKWELPYSREVNTAMHHDKYLSFENFDQLFTNWLHHFDILRKRGREILKFNNTTMRKILWSSAIVELRGIKMLAVNSTILISELGNLALEKCIPKVDVVLIWRYNIRDQLFECSVRTNESVDASVVAGLFNGGGHPRASGFSFSGNLLNEFIFIDRIRYIEK